MNPLLQRIKKAYHLETDAEVAEFLGINPSTLSMQKNRGKLDLGRIIEKCSDLNMNWLLDGTGPIRQDANNADSPNPIPIYSDSSLLHQKSGETQLQERIQISFVGDRSGYKHSLSVSGMKGFTVTGDAMAPTLRKDDIAIINTRNKHPEDGEIFLLSFNGSILCRRIQHFRETNERYRISSDNSNYDSFEVSKNDDLKVIGKVSLLVRGL